MSEPHNAPLENSRTFSGLELERARWDIEGDWRRTWEGLGWKQFRRVQHLDGSVTVVMRKNWRTLSE